MFEFQKHKTLLSYIPKKENVFFSLSTIHNDYDFNEETRGNEKLEFITFLH